ncbi:MAG: hypothetical protein ACLFWM_05845, partial [Actinomycetota bacterium]
MRFIVRPGTDPVATMDATLLKTLGLPSGGVVAVGKSHCLVGAGGVPEPTALLLGPRTMANAGLEAGAGVDVTRAIMAPASTVVLDAERAPFPPGDLVSAWQGRPVTAGDRLELPDGGEVRALEVIPEQAGTVGPGTRIVGKAESREPSRAHPGPVPPAPEQRITT